MTVAEAQPSALGERLADHLGEAVRRRPSPSLELGLAGIGGALIAAAASALAADRWTKSGSTGLAVLITAAVVGLALAAMVRAELPAHARPAGAAAAGIAAPSLAFYLVGGGGAPSVRSFAFAAGLFLAALYLTGPWRGHPFHLALLAVAGWLFGLSLVAQGQGGVFGGGLSFDTLGSALTEIGFASLVVGGLYLGVARWLDTQGLAGLATPFLGVSAVALFVGSVLVVYTAEDVVGGLVGIAVGAALCFVGACAHRRATLWAGLAAVAFGVSALAGALSGDDESAVLFALLIGAAGAGLVVVAPLVGARLPAPPSDDSEPRPRPGHDDGGEPPSPTPFIL